MLGDQRGWWEWKVTTTCFLGTGGSHGCSLEDPRSPTRGQGLVEAESHMTPHVETLADGGRPPR